MIGVCLVMGDRDRQRQTDRHNKAHQVPCSDSARDIIPSFLSSRGLVVGLGEKGSQLFCILYAVCGVM